MTASPSPQQERGARSATPVDKRGSTSDTGNSAYEKSASPRLREAETSPATGSSSSEAAAARGSEKDSTQSTVDATGVHAGQNGWTAVWDPSSNAYYFYRADTGETTWVNPMETPQASTSAVEESATHVDDSSSAANYGGIDPDLAYLDPSLARQTSSNTPSFQARFNSRTGRFQADPTMNPDRISDFSRSNRQQEVFYDPNAWQASLEGKGLQRNIGDTQRKRKPSSAEVEGFKEKKKAKQRAKMMDFLSN